MITAEAALLFLHKKAALCRKLAYHQQQIYAMKAGIIEGDRLSLAFLFLIAIYGHVKPILVPGFYPGMSKPPEQVPGSSFYRPDKSRSPTR